MLLEDVETIKPEGKAKEAVQAAYDSLWAAGILHGDVESRHIAVRKGKSEVVIIDFNRAAVIPPLQRLMKQNFSGKRRQS